MTASIVGMSKDVSIEEAIETSDAHGLTMGYGPGHSIVIMHEGKTGLLFVPTFMSAEMAISLGIAIMEMGTAAMHDSGFESLPPAPQRNTKGMN